MIDRRDKSIIVALDMMNPELLFQLVEQLDAQKCRIKVGKALFTRYGPSLIRQLQQYGFDIFLDLKFHDIPNTVAYAVAAAADLGVWMLNVHASGGARMLAAAREALVSFGKDAPELIAVTLLTSLEEHDLPMLGLIDPLPQQVERLALLTKSCGLDGVVCSAQEAAQLRALCGSPFSLVTPGIRPHGSVSGDQQRIMTPREAVAAGADYLVIGRPITHASSPLSVLQAIQHSLGADVDSAD